MIREWLRGKVQRQFPPVRADRRESLRRVKFTPRLESLEDRTLLSDGVLDPTFGTGGLVTTNLSYINNDLIFPATVFPSAPAHQNSIAVQTIAGVSKIIVAGVSQGPTTAFSIGRFTTGGSLDATFGTNGIATINFPGSSQANAAAIQSDGEIVVAGSTMIGGLPQFGLIRLTVNGSLDTAFGKNGFVTIPMPNLTSAANSVVVQGNGRIVVAGTAGGNFAIARVHADGLQDSDFNGGGITVFNIGLTLAAAFVPPTGSVDMLTSMALQPDGQIVVAGYTTLNATKDGLNPVPISNLGVPILQGTITNATNTGPITITSANHGLLSGTRVNISGVQGNTNANGSYVITVIDKNTFFLNGSTGNAAYTAGGTWTVTPPKAWNFAVARINAQNGLLDTSFSGGIVILDFFHALAGGKNYGLGDDMAENVIVQPDGKIIVAGRTWMDDNLLIKPNFGVARFNSDGSLDKSLNGDGLIFTDFSPDFSDAQDVAYSVGLQQDGKIVLAGTSDRRMNNVSNNNGFALVRYNTDGTEDQNFGLHGEVVTNFPNSTADQATNIIILPNTQILLAGTTKQGGQELFGLARYSGFESVQFGQASYSVQENGTSLLVTVTRSGFTGDVVTVNYATSDGTALAGTNYAATTGTLTFAPGQPTATFTIPILDDNIYQPSNSVFNLTLSNPGNVNLGTPKTAIVTIVETDQPGVLALGAGNYSVAQNGGSVEITVTRANGSAGPVGISYSTSNGTAVAGTDYTTTQGTLNLASGQTTATFTIPILNSGVSAPNSTTFNVSLSTPTGGATLGSPATAVVSIAQTNQVGGTTPTLGGGNPTPNQAFIMQAYLDLLGRAVDPAGLASWTAFLNAGGTTQQVAMAIENSQEYRQLVVQQLYSQYLHRAADPSGLANYTAFLAAGGTNEQIAAALLGSAEYFQTRGGGTNSGFLSALYQDVLGRPIDASGQATFTQFLASGGTPTQAAAVLLGSTEYDQNLVQGFYQHFLHRPADAAGLNAFVSKLQAAPTFQQPIVVSDPTSIINNALTDEAVIAIFVGSQEYFARVTQ
jgi:uncharacterized delta-60 repeat protein